MNTKKVEMCKKRYWNIIRALGYPSDSQEVVLGTEEHRVMVDLEDFFSSAVWLLSGHRLGFGGGMLYSQRSRKYWDAHFAIILLCEGEKMVEKRIIEWIENAERISLEDAEDAIKSAIKAMEWIEEGGKITEESLRHLHGGCVVVGDLDPRFDRTDIEHARNAYEWNFSDDVEIRLLTVLREGGASEDVVEKVMQRFRNAKKNAREKLEEVEEIYREIKSHMS